MAKGKIKKKALKRERKGLVAIQQGFSRVIAPATRELACSLANPFLCSACVPDGSSGTGCFSIKQVATLATGTGTCVGYAQNVHPSAWNKIDTASANSTPTFASNWTAATQNTSIASLYAQYRPVSMGVRAAFIGPTTADLGVLLIGQVSGRVPLSAFNGVSLTTAAAQCQFFELWPLRNGGTIRWDPEEMDNIEGWEASTTATTAVSSTDTHPYLIVLAYALQSSQGTLLIESVVNYEGLYQSTTFMPGGMDNSSRPAEPGWFEKAKAAVHDEPKIIPYIANGLGGLAKAGMVGYRMGGLYGAAAAVGGQALGYMANGLPAPGRLSKSSMPLLLGN